MCCGLDAVFQFTHPERCDNRLHGHRTISHPFNSRTPRGATRKCGRQPIISLLSIHAPREVRHLAKGAAKILGLFQFTHPERCDGHDDHALVVIVTFNSRTPRGATDYLDQLTASDPLSIHAPREVRLSKRQQGFFPPPLSIHAPREVRRESGKNQPGMASFNSRTPRGATGDLLKIRGIDHAFNSRTPRGATFTGVASCIVPSFFQFTHPERCDCSDSTRWRIDCTFQFTHPERCDRNTGRCLLEHEFLSIHAPREVRLKFCIVVGVFVRFQFTHPERCDSVLAVNGVPSLCFQFTHPERCDDATAAITKTTASFNSRTPRGATPSR